MNRLLSTHTVFIRVVSALVIVCFLVFDIAWAYPPGSSAGTNTLAQQTLFSSPEKLESFARVVAKDLQIRIRKQFPEMPLAGVEDMFSFLREIASSKLKMGDQSLPVEGGANKGQVTVRLSDECLLCGFNPKLGEPSLVAEGFAPAWKDPVEVNDYLSFQLFKTELQAADETGSDEIKEETLEKREPEPESPMPSVFERINNSISTNWDDVLEALRYISNKGFSQAQPFIRNLILALKSKIILKVSRSVGADIPLSSMNTELINILSKENYDYHLVRKLVKSIPRSGGESDLISAVEEIDERYTMGTGIGADIRQEAHRTLNQDLLSTIRAYKEYYLTGKADLAGLGRFPSGKEMELQKLGPNSPKIRDLLKLLDESESILARKFGNIEETGYLEEISLWKERLEKCESSSEMKGLIETLSKLEKSLNKDNHMKLIELLLQARSDIRELVKLVGASERFTLIHLDLFLQKIGDTQFGKITPVLFEDKNRNLPRILKLTQILVDMTLLSGVGGKHIEKFSELLTLPDLTFSQLEDLVGLINADAQDIVNDLDQEYREIATLVVGKKDPAKIEKALGNIKRDETDLNRLIEYLTELNSFLGEAKRYKHGEGMVYSKKKFPEINPLDQIIPLDDLTLEDLEKIKLIQALYGGKGTYLLYLRALGFPVPPGFIVPTSVAKGKYYIGRHRNAFTRKIRKMLHRLEERVISSKMFPQQFGKSRLAFGNLDNPLLVSVRTGTVMMMPGIMDTILNIGINDVIVETLAKRMNKWFAYDTYVRFLHSYGTTIFGMPSYIFERIEKDMLDSKDVEIREQLSGDDMKEMAEQMKATIKEAGYGKHLEKALRDPFIQLEKALYFVLDTWERKRAVEYRRSEGISDAWNTPATVQVMVFGNRNEDSGSGVVTSRNRETGKRELDGECCY